MEFTLSGQSLTLTKAAVVSALHGVSPEVVREHAVDIDGQLYPVKQVVALATGMDRLDFTSAQARSVLKRLGFDLSRRQAS